MLTQIKNVLIISALASSLAACSATTGGMSNMKMNHEMCKEMMQKKDCACCKMMQGQEDMRTSGMMTGGKQMMCKPKQPEQTPASVTEPKSEQKAEEAEHEAHHPGKVQ